MADLYTAASVGDYPGVGIPIYQLVTHIVILAGVLYNYWVGETYLFISGAIVLVNSPLYHACRGALYCFMMQLVQWRRLDHTGVLNLVCACVITVLHFEPQTAPTTRERWKIDSGAAARYLAPFVSYIAVHAYPFSVRSYRVVAVFLIVIALDRLLRHSHYYEGVDYRRFLRFRLLLLAAVFLVLGAATFSVDSGDAEGDALSDGVWHGIHHLVNGVVYLLISIAIRYASQHASVSTAASGAVTPARPSPHSNNKPRA